jgi:hypothetical protein
MTLLSGPGGTEVALRHGSCDQPGGWGLGLVYWAVHPGTGPGSPVPVELYWQALTRRVLRDRS